MSSFNARAYLCLSGLAFVVLDVVALFLPGPPPKASDAAGEIASRLSSHRLELMAGTYVSGFALVALVLFLGALRSWRDRTSSDPGLVVAACAGAVLGLATQIGGLLMFYGATFKVAGQHQDALVRALTDGGNAAVELSKFGFAAFIAGLCLAARPELGRRFITLGWVAAGLLVASAIPLVSATAVTQFGGGLDVVGAAPGIAWIAVLSVLMFRRLAAGEVRSRGLAAAPAG